MKWANYKVVVRFIPSGAESEITVRAVSKADALWRAVHRSLDARYEALAATKIE